MKRGYAAVGLYMPKTEMNVGGAMRAAYCYGASLIAVVRIQPPLPSHDLCTHPEYIRFS